MRQILTIVHRMSRVTVSSALVKEVETPGSEGRPEGFVRSVGSVSLSSSASCSETALGSAASSVESGGSFGVGVSGGSGCVGVDGSAFTSCVGVGGSRGT